MRKKKKKKHIYRKISEKSRLNLGQNSGSESVVAMGTAPIRSDLFVNSFVCCSCGSAFIGSSLSRGIWDLRISLLVHRCRPAPSQPSPAAVPGMLLCPERKTHEETAFSICCGCFHEALAAFPGLNPPGVLPSAQTEK